jgi:hypothetical protein
MPEGISKNLKIYKDFFGLLFFKELFLLSRR